MKVIGRHPHLHELKIGELEEISMNINEEKFWNMCLDADENQTTTTKWRQNLIGFIGAHSIREAQKHAEA